MLLPLFYAHGTQFSATGNTDCRRVRVRSKGRIMSLRNPRRLGRIGIMSMIKVPCYNQVLCFSAAVLVYPQTNVFQRAGLAAHADGGIRTANVPSDGPDSINSATIDLRAKKNRVGNRVYSRIGEAIPHRVKTVLESAMKTYLFELCVENLEAARAAEAGGADRIELCTDLSVGGITPDPALMQATIAALSIPVHVLVRPRAGHFVFTPDEFELMREEVRQAKEAGAAGVAVGILHESGRVDVERTHELVESAYPMKATFHRAFDETPDMDEALEDVIRCGADCLLTSGGAPNVLEGARSIALLRNQAGERLDIMAGGGLRLETLAEVVRQTGITLLHGSLQRKRIAAANGNGHSSPPDTRQLEIDVREAVRLFRLETEARPIRAVL